VARWRKKPVIVEAEQWFPGKDVPGVWGLPGQDMCPCYEIGGDHNLPHVMTANEQRMDVVPGDWIIREPDGRGYYPCKPDIFAANYEPALRGGSKCLPLA
jgi:hypothetical protein